ncbi:hypothetical protein T10_2316 [Trichinella papuae]|uniref:Uncharacterized protein n=1 Tax=Trichinella papuae TaxID=268474 RepID=A0A0V1MCQ5_9BILA|nr:hypothetical protein T10_2316 [Trichinella papuae]
MPSGKHETERKGNPPANTGSSPFGDERANSAAEEVNEPARGIGSLHGVDMYKFRLNVVVMIRNAPT